MRPLTRFWLWFCLFLVFCLFVFVRMLEPGSYVVTFGDLELGRPLPAVSFGIQTPAVYKEQSRTFFLQLSLFLKEMGVSTRCPGSSAILSSPALFSQRTLNFPASSLRAARGLRTLCKMLAYECTLQSSGIQEGVCPKD